MSLPDLENLTDNPKTHIAPHLYKTGDIVVVRFNRKNSFCAPKGARWISNSTETGTTMRDYPSFVLRDDFNFTRRVVAFDFNQILVGIVVVGDFNDLGDLRRHSLSGEAMSYLPITFGGESLYIFRNGIRPFGHIDDQDIIEDLSKPG